MNTERIISNLLDKAYDSTVSYAELGSSANDLTVQMLKEIEKGLNKQGVSLRLPDEPEMRKALGLPEKGKPLKEEKLTTEQYNLLNRCYLEHSELLMLLKNMISTGRFLLDHTRLIGLIK